MKLISCSPFLCLLLIPSLVVSPLAAQSPAPLTTTSDSAAAQSNAVDPTDLQVRVVEGSGAEAKVNSIAAKPLTVAVTNASGAAVPDAAVAVRLPDSGPTGTFADGSHAAVAYTDASGLAHFAGLHWGSAPGSLSLRVTATKGSSHAAVLLNQNLIPEGATVVQVLQPAAPKTPAPPSVSVAAPAVVQPGQTAKALPPAQAQPVAKAQPLVKTGASPMPIAAAPAATSKLEPTVSVTGASPDASQHSGKTKWFIIAAVVAGAAGAGVAMMGKGKSTSAPAASGLSIGTPSVSVGAPTH